MSDRRVLGFCWFLAALFVWMVLSDLTEWILTTPLEDTGLAGTSYFGGTVKLYQLIGAGAAAIVAIFTWNHREAFGFCLEVVQETRKVVWPTKQETQDHTVVVVVTSIIIAAMLWGFDQVFKRLFKIILELGT